MNEAAPAPLPSPRPGFAGIETIPFRREADGELRRLIEALSAALDPDDIEIDFLFQPDGARYRRRFLSGNTRPVRSSRPAKPTDGEDAGTLLCVPFRVDALLEGVLTLERRPRRRWTAAERARFDLLTPFLAHVVEALARGEVDAAASRRLSTVAQRSAVPLFTFDLQGALLYANPAGYRLLERQGAEGFTVLLDDHCLPLLVHLQRLVLQSPPVARERLPLTNGCSLEAHIANGGGPEDGAIRVVTLHERAAITIDDVRPQLLSRGVSCREAEVVAGVLSGLRNAEIARTLFITEYTVKDHLKHVFHKLGVDSRSGLLRALYSSR